ncbi:unnamed protein product [Hermetia illucens]|uniref:Fibrillar collagen NC1 domain-containing protein n=1 Tax=Hermetia illucens TaxID=343691 RepID=A0A7R8UPN1_HERIL|nr:neprilysin-4-like [Hermetia illucens]CAD7084708.1 unnamed protein product [Hermetia illucens]
MWLMLFIVSIMWTTNKCYAGESPESIRNEQGLMMKSFMNESINPCDNFYKYACGNWAKHQTFEKTNKSFGIFGVLTRQVNKFIDDFILFNNHTSATSEETQKILESSEVKKVQRYFSICRQQKKLKREPYIETWNVPGGWPVLNSSWSDQTFDWINITGQLKLIGGESLIDVHVGPHYENATRNTIYIFPAAFPLFQPSLFEENLIVKQIVAKMISLVIGSFGLDELKLNKTVSDVLSFETKLASVYLKDEEDEGEYDRLEDMTLEALQEIFPDIDFHRLLTIVSGQEISKSQMVTLSNGWYFENLMDLLNETKSEDLANFFLYRFGLQIGVLQPVDNYCRNEVIKHMGFFLGYIYNTAFNNERDNEDVRKLAQSIKSVFAEIIQKTDWIDSDTKAEASIKLDNLLLKVGASEDSLRFSEIKEEFSLIDFDPNDYYRSYFKLLAFSVQKPFRTLNKSNDRSDTNHNAATVRAFYSLTKNHLVIPTNVLQKPVYNFYFPNSVKYGALGYILGHEVTHSVDGNGRTYDSEGTIRQWWTEKSEEEYLNRTSCLTAQYANYTPNFLNASANSIGASTVNENIADNGGIRQSFQAYKAWFAKHPDEQETLPHLNLTNTQLFFLSFAQFYCQVTKPGSSLVSTLTDEHASGKNRVIGTLSNFEEFSKEFNCPVGSKMNPAKKCRVW